MVAMALNRHRAQPSAVGSGQFVVLGNVFAVYVLDVEGRVVESLLHTVDPVDADAMRRTAPVRRDQFDNFIFEATRWAVGEATPDSFAGACFRFRSAHKRNPASITRPVPLVPPATVETVARIVTRWQRGSAQDRGGAGAAYGELSPGEARIRDELYLTVGGDHGDGVIAAGLRLYSRLWSARIGDGFTHPAVGGRIWSINSAGTIYSNLYPVGGPLIAALDNVHVLATRWEEEPNNRPQIDRDIIDSAHSLGW